jgi:UDP-N-acetylglucosamine acyltransferase
MRADAGGPSTAIVDREAELADDVSIGPYCVIRGRVRIGAGTQLSATSTPGAARARRAQPAVAVRGARLRAAAPRLGPDRPGAGLAIGDENTFRESVTISRAASDEVPTRVGSRNYWMANSHAGHDCEIGNGCVIANGTLLAGSVRLGDGVVTGGNVAVHQFCQVGRGALLCGTFGSEQGPAAVLHAHGREHRRQHQPDRHAPIGRAARSDRRRALGVQDAVPARALVATLRSSSSEQRKERPIVAEYLAFLAGSKRGLCPARGEARRGTGTD